MKAKLYLFGSTRKSDKIKHPISVLARSERSALLIITINFRKHNYKGSPVRIAL